MLATFQIKWKIFVTHPGFEPGKAQGLSLLTVPVCISQWAILGQLLGHDVQVIVQIVRVEGFEPPRYYYFASDSKSELTTSSSIPACVITRFSCCAITRLLCPPGWSRTTKSSGFESVSCPNLHKPQRDGHKKTRMRTSGFN